MKHHYQDLIQLFNQTFQTKYNTELVCGKDEPIYLPADGYHPYHRIIFAHGFYASAIHEISHWCIAGQARRLQEDYGYWYCPDGRSAEKQREFEKVEIKPQALDWLFCVAAGFPFNVSCDNLNSEIELDRTAFQRRVHRQVLSYLQLGIPERPTQFIRALQQFYATPALGAENFPYPQY